MVSLLKKVVVISKAGESRFAAQGKDYLTVRTDENYDLIINLCRKHGDKVKVQILALFHECEWWYWEGLEVTGHFNYTCE